MNHVNYDKRTSEEAYDQCILKSGEGGNRQLLSLFIRIIALIMERYFLISSYHIRYSREKTLEVIDEKLKAVKDKLPKEQQMDMEEFYIIFTRSNELIHVVDCRSQEEYDACHISGSKRLVEY